MRLIYKGRLYRWERRLSIADKGREGLIVCKSPHS